MKSALFDEIDALKIVIGLQALGLNGLNDAALEGDEVFDRLLVSLGVKDEKKWVRELMGRALLFLSDA